MTPPSPFSRLHAALREQVDREFLPCVSTALLRGREVVDVFVHGLADREAGVPLREDHLFRMFSNTKLVTACAVLLLVEEGRLGLDDALERWIPALGARRVLRPGARSLDDTELARSSITVRQLLSHTSGLTYGIFEPGTPLAQAYAKARVLNAHTDLQGLVDALAPLPLAFHPGTRWEYSVASDVLGRVVEVVSGQRFGAFLAQRIFEPLQMADTGFWVPPAQQQRLCALYRGVDVRDPTRPGLVRVDDKPFPGAYLQPAVREGGGGGLVSTLGDTVRLLQALIPGGPTLLRPATLQAMWRNQLPPGLPVAIANVREYQGRGFGLGSSVVLQPAADDPPASAGEVAWGGMAGTMWWIHPGHGVAGVLMTQRYQGSGDPYAQVFKREAYRALGLEAR